MGPLERGGSPSKPVPGPVLMSGRQRTPRLGIRTARVDLCFGSRLVKPPPLPRAQFPHLDKPVQLMVLRWAPLRLMHS